MDRFFKKEENKIGVSLDSIGSDFNPAEFDKDKNGKSRILQYNPSSLFHYGFVNPVGSTLTYGLLFRTLVMCGVATFTARFTCATKQTYSFCFPIVVSGEGLIFAGLVSFLLGLFTSTTFSRWWSIREKLGIVMNNTTVLAMNLASFCPNDADTIPAKTRLMRLMHLAHSLIYKQANNDLDYTDLLDQRLITQAEVDFLHENKDLSKPTIVYSWCLSALQPLLPKITPALAQSTSVATISACMTSAQEVSAFLKTQMPYMYLHLLALTTKVHLILIVFYAGGVLSQGMASALWTRIILGYTIVIANNVIYEGLLRVHEMLYNPLGDDNADFPTHLYVASTVALGTAIGAPQPSHEEDNSSKHTEVTVY